MSIAPLLEHLRRDAMSETAQRLDDTRAAAKTIASSLEARLDRERTARLEAARREINRNTEKRRDAARQRANEITITARQRFITRVLETARTRARDRAGDPAIAPWLTRMLGAALACIPPGTAIVRIPPTLAPLVRSLPQRGEWTLEIRGDETLPVGLVVEAPDGSLHIDATLERMLHAERPRIAIWLLREAAAS